LDEEFITKAELMNNENSIDEVLLGKFMAGEASPEEAILVTDWIAASQENKTHYAKLERTWAFGVSQFKSTPKKDMVWRALQQNISNKKNITRKPAVITYRIAAAILLLIGLSVAFYLFVEEQNEPELAWQTTKTMNEIASLSLSDGSSVTVNRNSLLKWQANPDDKIRKVLLEGEAFFDVAHDPDRPFIITTNEIKIKVLGTSFNVLDKNLKDEIETEVVRGKVLVYTPQQQIIVEAGMTGVYHKITKKLVLVKTENENSIAYATHSLSFSASTLKTVTEQLSKVYGVQFVFENKKTMDCRLTSEYQNKSLSFIMNVISASLNLTYTIKNKTVFISGDGCI